MKRRDHQVSINIFEQINQICQEFRRGWKDGKRPRIEDVILRVNEGARTNLFVNLIQLEIRYRENLNECPASAEYLTRFPEFALQVRQSFDESTSMSVDFVDETPSFNSADFRQPEGGSVSFDSLASGNAPFAPAEMPAARRIGNYELIRELGRGGMGVVYEARHLQRQNHVALKTLPTGTEGQKINADRLHKFRNEFRSLSEIYHPNLVGMQTLEVDGSQWFFTMDLIDGADFLSYVRPGGALDEQRLRSTLKQLATGMIFLHECGIVHRDLKPSNVLVEESGCVKLLDFGLVAQLQQSSDQSANLSTVHFAGTPRYAAPEQMFGERTKATDWYALATMTYEALTGVPPFTGRQMDVLKQKQVQDSPRLADDPSFPVDLANLVDGLLKRDPDQRPTTAQIVSALQLNLETRGLGSTQDSHEASDSSPDDQLELDSTPEEEIILIGREQQLAQLETAKNEVVENRQPLIVWITGKSGEGKSSVAEKFLRPIRKGTDMLALSGRCYDRESVPFKAVDCIIESLVRYLRSSHGKWLKAEQPEDVEFLAQVFPLLRRVDWIAERDIHDLAHVDPQKIRGRAFYGLRQLLTAIGRRTPLVIHIDDLQWGDADSARAWHEILNHPEAPPILVLGSYRSDEADDSPFLTNWNQLKESAFHQVQSRSIAVVPLSKDECLALAVIRTGMQREAIEEQIGQLFHETDGNPYFLDQLLEGYDPAAGDFRHVPIDEIVSGRLSRLPSAATKLLHIISISGQPIRIAEAASVSGVGNAALATLTHMRSERLVRLLDSGVEPMVETWHDKVRESVLGQLSTETKQQLHLRLATEIEGKQNKTAEDWLSFLRSNPTPGEYQFNPSDRVLDLSRHFAAANDVRAFIYQWLAGEQAMRTYAVEEAFDMFQQARSSMPETAPATLRYRFWMGLGRVLLWYKSHERAIEAYKQASELAPGKIEIVEAYAGLQAANMQAGRYDEGIRWMDKSLAKLRIRPARTKVGKVISFVEKNLRLLFIPESWQVAKTDEQRQLSRLTHDVLFGAYLAYCEKDLLFALEGAVRASHQGIESGNSSKAAMGWCLIANVWSALGVDWLGRYYLSCADRTELTVNDPELAGVFLCYSGFREYYSGNLLAAEDRYRAAFPLLIRCLRVDTLQLCTHLQRHVQAYIGDTQSELENANATLELAKSTGNVIVGCWGSFDAANASARLGALANAVNHMRQANRMLPDSSYILTPAIQAATGAYVRLQCSDYASAYKLADFSWSVIWRGWMANDVTLLCAPLLIESVAGPNFLDVLPSQDRGKLRRALRWAKLFYLTIPNHQPHLRRVFGRAYCRLGKHRKAISQFNKAIQLCKKKGMKYQQAKCLLDLAAVQEQGREENRAEAIELLKIMGSVIPRAESWLLGDQYDEAVVAPEFDLAAWERENGPIRPQTEDAV